MTDKRKRADDIATGRIRAVDLADIKASTTPKRASTADTEIAAAIASAKRDRIGEVARAGATDTSTAFLKRSLAEADPLRTAIERAGLFGSGAVRDAMTARNLVSEANKLASGSLIGSATLDAARGSIASRTARDILAAERKMSDLILGRGVGAPLASAVAEAQARTGRFDWASHYATGRAAMTALEETYQALGMGRRHDRLLGVVSGVGSLARIATGLTDPASDMRLRASAMFAETQARINAQANLGTIGGALHAGYGDLFPAMRQARASEIDAVIAATQRFTATATYPDWTAQAQARLSATPFPWVRVDLPDASIEAMARLNALTREVDAASPSDAGLIEALRGRLGDYRDDPAPEASAIEDPVARTAYQLDRGFDPVLTVLPTAVVATMFSPFHGEDPAVAVDPDHLENAVRMLLKRLEHALRRFIAAKLAEMYGSDWFDRLPSDMRRSWRAGRQKDVDAGRTPDDLIAYADIDHYRKIIEHPERWDRLFEPVFKDQVAIRETLRRIAVIRNPGAHFRAVTVEDLIILRAEGVHLASWLRIRLGD